MKTIIIVGNGMVGFKFCEKFLALSKDKKFQLTVFGEEPSMIPINFDLVICCAKHESIFISA